MLESDMNCSGEMADPDHAHEGVFHARILCRSRPRKTLQICCIYREMQCCNALPAPNAHSRFQCAPKRSDWVAMRTSMKNAPKAAVRQIMAATNKMATAPDKLMETNADANSDITTSETSRADIVQSAIAAFM